MFGRVGPEDQVGYGISGVERRWCFCLLYMKVCCGRKRMDVVMVVDAYVVFGVCIVSMGVLPAYRGV